METEKTFDEEAFHFLNSLLVREINWMETALLVYGELLFQLLAPYSLGKLIEWKPQPSEKEKSDDRQDSKLPTR